MVIAVGVGTILFHGTLQYWAQLVDELPIYYLGLMGVWELLPKDQRSHSDQRMATGQMGLVVESTGGASPRLAWVAAVWAVLLSVFLFAVPQAHTAHQVARGIMSATFAAMFIGIFVGLTTRLNAAKETALGAATATNRADGSSGSGNDDGSGSGSGRSGSGGRGGSAGGDNGDTRTRSSNGANRTPSPSFSSPSSSSSPASSLEIFQTLETLQSILRRGLGSFVFGVVCWILDNGCCGLFRRAFRGMPLRHPHFHALWHIGAGVGLYLLWLVVAATHILKKSAAASPSVSSSPSPFNIGWRFAGTIPVIELSVAQVAEHAATKKIKKQQ